jgi:uncharacterized protein YndB with AHSA1/START domain
MKIFGLVLLVLVFAAVLVYAVGASLPVNHTVSVTGVVPAPPDRVFALITDVANSAAWRPEIKSVSVLAPVDGPNGKQAHWVESLGHGQTMTFLAVRTEPVMAVGPTVGPETVVASRVVLLEDPRASYGGTWTYELSPGPSPNSTTLRITETGFIHPPLYRFMMVHVFGPTRNLNLYMKDLQAAAAKP